MHSASIVHRDLVKLLIYYLIEVGIYPSTIFKETQEYFVK